MYVWVYVCTSVCRYIIYGWMSRSILERVSLIGLTCLHSCMLDSCCIAFTGACQNHWLFIYFLRTVCRKFWSRIDEGMPDPIRIRISRVKNSLPVPTWRQSCSLCWPQQAGLLHVHPVRLQESQPPALNLTRGQRPWIPKTTCLSIQWWGRVKEWIIHFRWTISLLFQIRRGGTRNWRCCLRCYISLNLEYLRKKNCSARGMKAQPRNCHKIPVVGDTLWVKRFDRLPVSA